MVEYTDDFAYLSASYELSIEIEHVLEEPKSDSYLDDIDDIDLPSYYSDSVQIIENPNPKIPEIIELSSDSSSEEEFPETIN